MVFLHILLGIFVNQIPEFSKLYFSLVCAYFLFNLIVSPKRDKVMWVLFGCAYISAAEALFRMTGSGLFYEFSKYFVILLCLIGIAYKGVSGRAYPYLIYLVLLIPAIIIASSSLGYDLDFRKSVAFVLSGPICLGIAALFCYEKRVTYEELLNVLACASYPIIAMTTHLFLYNPSVKEVITSTASNYQTSGGFGPNQVSTLLGLGMVALVVRFFMKSPSSFLKMVNLILLCAVTFRALVTFSRGGVFASILVIGAFLWLLFIRSNARKKREIIGLFSVIIIGSLLTWMVTVNQTSGLLENRYANKDAVGREKEDISTGRWDIFKSELEGFEENPVFGVGAGVMKQYRLESEGRIVASHNEISRLISEHGMLGIIILLLLIFAPLIYRTRNKGNILFFAFLAFWFATINHSAMRIAAPGFVYALALLNVYNEKKRPLHRQRIIQPR